jgi:hypothetical protein
MKTIVCLLLFASLQFCFGQIDTDVLAIGDWSEVVRDDDGHAIHALRGRLLVYDKQSQSAANHARVYLELQNVFEGGWSLPLEVCFDISFLRGDLHFEMRDALDKPIPQEGVAIRGPMPEPYHVILPCDSTVRLRADFYTLGSQPKPEGIVIFVNGGRWIIRPNARTIFSYRLHSLLPKIIPHSSITSGRGR